MTNGVIVALGDVGRNVAAGMSGGILYLYSEGDDDRPEINRDNVQNIFRVTSEAGEKQLKELVEKHLELTGSRRAAEILKDWKNSLHRFWQVAPVSMQQSDVVAISEAPVETARVAMAARVTKNGESATQAVGPGSTWPQARPPAL